MLTRFKCRDFIITTKRWWIVITHTMGWLKFWALVLLCLAFLASVTECKKTKKKKSASGKKKKVDMNGSVDSGTLKCLVCRSVVEEFESAIYMVDPNKIVDGGYHFREVCILFHIIN